MTQNGCSTLALLVAAFALCAHRSAAIGVFNRLYGDDGRPHSRVPTNSKPLDLSDMLQSGKDVNDIRGAAEVDIGNRKTYAGFFKTDSAADRNMFFWFLPAMNGDQHAPLVIWLQGGPGGSSLFGMFHEIGPWALAPDSSGDVHLVPRKFTWNQKYSLLFIDNPVGAGFSYTTKPEGYCKTEEEVAESLFSTLTQFYAIFKEQRNVDLYLTGESYAGHYLPAFAFKIVKTNPSLPPNARIPFKGVAIGDGWIDPINMLPAYSSMLLGMGMVGAKEGAVIRDYTDRIVAAIEGDQMELAFRIWDEMINGDLFPYGSYFYNVTGSKDYDNFLNTEEPPDLGLYARFLNQEEVREALHVGDAPFGSNSSECERHLVSDFMRSLLPELQAVIPHGKVLIYSGNLDIIVGFPLTEAFVSKMSFPGSNAFHAAPRRQFRTRGGAQVAGFVRHAARFTQAVVRNAGHLVPHDQPQHALDLISRFIESEDGWCDCPPCDDLHCCPSALC